MFTKYLCYLSAFFEIKSGLSRNKISKLMDAETWMNAKEAVKLGFADEILFSDSTAAPAEQLDNSSVEMLFSRKTVTDSLLSKLIPKRSKDAPEPETHSKKPAVKAAELQKRLSLLSH